MKRITSIRLGLVIAIGCAVFFALYGALEVFVRNGQSGPVMKSIASFACFGFLVGGILAFDSLPGESGPDRPLLRVAIGTISGLLLGLLWKWPGEGVALSALLAAALGYAGTMWAKYV